jgi:hypothetical protein
MDGVRTREGCRAGSGGIGNVCRRLQPSENPALPDRVSGTRPLPAGAAFVMR